jgi:hypothetical protein
MRFNRAYSPAPNGGNSGVTPPTIDTEKPVIEPNAELIYTFKDEEDRKNFEEWEEYRKKNGTWVEPKITPEDEAKFKESKLFSSAYNKAMAKTQKDLATQLGLEKLDPIALKKALEASAKLQQIEDKDKPEQQKVLEQYELTIKDFDEKLTATAKEKETLQKYIFDSAISKALETEARSLGAIDPEMISSNINILRTLEVDYAKFLENIQNGRFDIPIIHKGTTDKANLNKILTEIKKSKPNQFESIKSQNGSGGGNTPGGITSTKSAMDLIGDGLKKQLQNQER